MYRVDSIEAISNDLNKKPDIPVSVGTKGSFNSHLKTFQDEIDKDGLDAYRDKHNIQIDEYDR